MVASKKSKCAVRRGEVDLDWYSHRDQIWREIGLSAPARRALVNAGVLKLNDLAKKSRSEIAKLHGMGPSGVRILDRALKKSKGLKWR